MASTNPENQHPPQWNAGGWFGAQLGSSCWILIAGLLTYPHNQLLSLLITALFAGFNLAGCLLWANRRRLSAYMGMQMLIILAGLAGLLTVYLLDSNGLFTDIQTGGSVSAGKTYLLIIAVVAALLLMFYLRFSKRPR